MAIPGEIGFGTWGAISHVLLRERRVEVPKEVALFLNSVPPIPYT